MSYAAPLCIDLRPSRRLQGLFLLVLMLALAAPWLSRLPVAAAAGLDLGLLLWAYPQWRRLGLRSDHAVVALYWDAQGFWTLRQRDGSETTAQLQPRWRATPRFISLPFKSDKGRHSLLLLPDSAHRELLRRLRVRLRIEG